MTFQLSSGLSLADVRRLPEEHQAFLRRFQMRTRTEGVLTDEDGTILYDLIQQDVIVFQFWRRRDRRDPPHTCSIIVPARLMDDLAIDIMKVVKPLVTDAFNRISRQKKPKSILLPFPEKASTGAGTR